VAADVTVPATLTLQFGPGGSLAIATGITVTINGYVIAGLYKIFSCTGTGKVVFGIGSVPEIFAEWWGMDGAAVQAAIDAATNVKAVCLQRRNYLVATGLTCSLQDLRLYCRAGRATLYTTTDIDLVTVSERMVMQNIFVLCWCGTASTKSGIIFTDLAYYCHFDNVVVHRFAYNWDFQSSSVDGIAQCYFSHCIGYLAEICEVRMVTTGSGWMNENTFVAMALYPSATGICVQTAAASNNNKFLSCSFEGGNPYDFAVKEYGLNVFDDCRWEGAGFGIWIDNGVSQWDYLTRLNCNFWLCKLPYIVIVSGRAKIHDGKHDGKTATDTSGSTTVDADSASGQKVLNVAATTSFNVADAVLINSGGAREEWNEIASIQAGVSLTLQNNLRYQHTAVQADAVVGYGLLSRPGRVAKSTTQEVPGVVIKTDTGDPSYSYDGMICINTFDNNIKMYGDSGWRELGTWT
jgi:hypothetical protein